MQVFDLEKALRILKSRKIKKETVAKVTGVSTGYLSKMANGKMPVSQNYVDVFMKEYGKDIEGVTLIESTPSRHEVKIISLEAKVEVLTRISLASFGALGAMSGNFSGKGLEFFMEKVTDVHLKEFDALVEGKVERLLSGQESNE